MTTDFLDRNNLISTKLTQLVTRGWALDRMHNIHNRLCDLACDLDLFLILTGGRRLMLDYPVPSLVILVSAVSVYRAHKWTHSNTQRITDAAKHFTPAM